MRQMWCCTMPWWMLDLLEYAPNAEHIFVGKRKGCYAYQQDQINELIVSRAKTHGHVVRLKGGDPLFLVEELKKWNMQLIYGLEVAMVPGISSSVCSTSIPKYSRYQKRCFRKFLGNYRNNKRS